jgi:enamine deaminase RidA (YjgF/YER057c/UK114 family)
VPEICHEGIATRRHRVYEDFSTKVSLVDLADFTKFNVVYAGQFASGTKPVRTTVRADLVADVRVEVTAIARRAR